LTRIFRPLLVDFGGKIVFLGLLSMELRSLVLAIGVQRVCNVPMYGGGVFFCLAGCEVGLPAALGGPLGRTDGPVNILSCYRLPLGQLLSSFSELGSAIGGAARSVRCLLAPIVVAHVSLRAVMSPAALSTSIPPGYMASI
jgi:hypothetical protein